MGKTYIAKRVAWSLIGRQDRTAVQMVQFHQSYAYEDFIQGWRPTDTGGFTLREGVFYKFCKRAEEHPDRSFVFIIDEINRGNLSRIFGELLMLIEPDKRGEEHAIPLTYSEPGENFSVPDNVHILGMMNTADRYSGLAVVTSSSADYTLVEGRPVRRRRAPMTRGLNRNHNRGAQGCLQGRGHGRHGTAWPAAGLLSRDDRSRDATGTRTGDPDPQACGDHTTALEDRRALRSNEADDASALAPGPHEAVVRGVPLAVGSRVRDQGAGGSLERVVRPATSQAEALT